MKSPPSWLSDGQQITDAVITTTNEVNCNVGYLPFVTGSGW